MASPIQNRYEFVLFFDVENGNPNGDPDAGNMPRLDPETNHGLVTDVCLKRKVRNYVQLAKGATPFVPLEAIAEGRVGHNIYIKEKAVLNQVHTKANEELDYPKDKKKAAAADKVEGRQKWLSGNYFDIRSFGAVLSVTDYKAGQVTGPVQFNFARSIDPIMPLEVSITRMAVTTQKEADSQSGDNRTMGRKHIVPYGLYRAEGYISPGFAEKTGFNEDDLSLLWVALENMFEHDRSAARGKMAARRLIVFKHDSALGNAPAHKLFDLVSAKKVIEESKPPRAFTDYKITIDEASCPDGVSIEEPWN